VEDGESAKGIPAPMARAVSDESRRGTRWCRSSAGWLKSFVDGGFMHRLASSILGVIVSFHAIAASCQTPTQGQPFPPATNVSPTTTVPPVSIVTPANSQRTKPNLPAAEESPQSGTPSDPSQPVLFTRAKADEGLRIGGGDLLQVMVFGASDYNHEVRVSRDGSVSLPFLGQVQAAGLTTRQLAADLQTRLSQGGYFNDPQVSVFVKEYATQGVSLLGEVQKPGVYPLLGSRTLFDMLSAASGTTQTAGDKVYITHRDRPQQPEIIKLTYDAKGLAQSNVPVFPGDTIIVQKAGMVYVVGNVQKPTGIAMVDPGLTVLKAIALAQGIAPNAALGSARLVRKSSDGQVAIPLPIKKMLAAQAPDMRLEPEDVIFIPNSAAMNAFKRSLELALQTASGVIIYRRQY
jgi:polysaccharide biosynthesis/export protein